jgi:hypothetical protein
MGVSSEFPAGREFCREFCGFEPHRFENPAQNLCKTSRLRQIPQAAEQGIQAAEQGIRFLHRSKRKSLDFPL